MKKSIKIKLETYNSVLTFIVCDDIAKESSSIYKKYKIVTNVQDDVEGLFISPDINNHYLLIDSKFLTHNTIAHEIFHSVVHITESRDIVDEEAQCWLAGYITERIYKFLDKNNINIKHEAIY
jgi:hypothetical protein